MRNTIIMLAALAGSAFAASALPAAAQNWNAPGYGYGSPRAQAYIAGYTQERDDHDHRVEGRLQAREESLGQWIGRDLRDGRLPQWRARALFAELREVREEQRQICARQGGRIYPDQARRLEHMLDRLKDRVVGAQDYAREDRRDRRW